MKTFDNISRRKMFESFIEAGIIVPDLTPSRPFPLDNVNRLAPPVLPYPFDRI
jgi:hypothetical protein